MKWQLAIQRINEIKSCFLERTNKIDILLAKLTEETEGPN
jgi:hypothetical protein